MYSGVYGSPFPKLNPNVRYRTVFERAGFETNKNSNSPPGHNGMNNTVHPSHNHPQQQQQQFTPTKTLPHPNNNNNNNVNNNNDTYNVTLPILSEPQSSHVSPNKSMNSNRISPPQQQQQEDYHSQPYMVQQPNQQSQESFNFENKQRGSAPIGNDTQEMNPIDKSFMMLTQNDSSSMSSQSRSTSNHNTYNSSLHKDIVVTQPGGSSHSSTSSHFKKLPSPVKELDLEYKEPDFNLKNTDSISFEPDSVLVDQVSETHIRDPIEEIGTDTIMSKNLQVEQLIAELDGVSFSRNEEISQTLMSSHTNSNLMSDSSSIRTNPISNSIEDPRLKKSSAYLSGFPLRSQGSSPDSKHSHNESLNSSAHLKVFTDINNNDSNNSINNVDGTPTFYKFVPKDTDFNKEQTVTATISSSSPLSNESEIKYPPGEGPCRLCGKEITEKGVFSKKANELSGQWHRNCFRCTNCSVKFNKKVPCYILNDKPYCQQHYHEENHSICQVCSKFIEGECLENDNMERFHIDCLKCFICKKIIENDYFIFNDEVPICADHDMETLIENGLASLGNNDTENDTRLNRNNTFSKRRTRVISFMG